MKTPVPVPNVPVAPGRGAFMPVIMVNHPPANLGLTKPYTGPREDGCHAYVNYDGVTPIQYNGQNQTKTINQTFRP